jgi:hypothetical protein
MSGLDNVGELQQSEHDGREREETNRCMPRSDERARERATRPRTLLLWLVAGLAVALGGAAVTRERGADAPYGRLLQSCRESRAQRYLSCLRAAVLQYAYEHPQKAGSLLGYVAEHGRDGESRVDLRQLSATAHYVGMELSVRPLSLADALRDCGDAFKAGCMHGFVMERLDRDAGSGRRLLPTFLGYCRPVSSDSDLYENCLHGVGHELWARTRLPLGDTLGLCDRLAGSADRSACWSGVLMEYSEGMTVKGRHGHRPAGERTLPCGSLAARYREVCTYAEASYRQYVPGWEPALTTYERCDAAPRADRLHCMALVSERLLIAEAGDARLAEATCAQLRSARSVCDRSIAELRAPGRSRPAAHRATDVATPSSAADNARREEMPSLE